VGGAVYILPNLLTTGNLFFGFFSVIKAYEGQFGWAAAAIFLASVFDLLDGRVARLTHSTSEFGVQYDSLCDLFSFGAAPALLMYKYGLHSFPRIGWIVCFIFLACGALRLARFNVQSAIGKAGGDFTGLPIPMAAFVVAAFIAAVEDIKNAQSQSFWLTRQLSHLVEWNRFLDWFLLFFALSLAFLMVSNIAYRSHKSINIKHIKPFTLLAILVAIIGFAAYHPELVGFFLAITYAISGPFEWLMGWKKLTDDDEIFSPNEDDFSVMEPKEETPQSGEEK
jgi:CDP-diacylglycerol--serine O-phosphatidyltransferase